MAVLFFKLTVLILSLHTRNPLFLQNYFKQFIRNHPNKSSVKWNCHLNGVSQYFGENYDLWWITLYSAFVGVWFPVCDIFHAFSNKGQPLINFRKTWELRRKSKHFREWRGGGEPVYLEESLHVFEMLQNIWQGMISTSSCSCNTYLFTSCKSISWPEISDQSEIFRNQAPRIRRREDMDFGGWEELQGKDESYRSRFLWNCNFEHIVREHYGIMVSFGNSGKKRKLSRKRNVTN